jgi:hypothetical protein
MRLLLFHSGAADRARATSMPDTTWPISGHPPGSSRDLSDTPVSMSSEVVSTRQQWFTRVRLPSPRLTSSTRRLFLDRSPRRSSTNAARGGLKPPSAGRLRRATKPSSPEQHHSRKTSLYRILLHIQDTRRVAPGVAARGSHRTVRDSLPSYGSCCPGHQTGGIQVTHRQWAKNRGLNRTAHCHSLSAFPNPRNRLNFFRSHRIR